MPRPKIHMTFRRDGNPGSFSAQKDNETMRKFAYSYDREDYVGAYESAEEALAAAVENSQGLSNPPTTVYVGTIVFPNSATRGPNGFYLVPLFGAE